MRPLKYSQHVGEKTARHAKLLFASTFPLKAALQKRLDAAIQRGNATPAPATVCLASKHDSRSATTNLPPPSPHMTRICINEETNSSVVVNVLMCRTEAATKGGAEQRGSGNSGVALIRRCRQMACQTESGENSLLDVRGEEGKKKQRQRRKSGDRKQEGSDVHISACV